MITNRLQRILRESQGGTFALQITSMIDMFTLILVFLLKSYSTSSVDITPTKNLTLPASTSQVQPVEALKLLVSTDGIFVDDKQIVSFQNGSLPSNVVDNADRRFIRPLYEALDAQAKKSKNISKQNESVAFDGKVIFQADKGLNYELIKKVMYTSTLAGYSEFKFAVVSN